MINQVTVIAFTNIPLGMADFEKNIIQQGSRNGLALIPAKC